MPQPARKRQRVDPNNRTKLGKGLGLPEFGKYAPERMKTHGNKPFAKVGEKRKFTALGGSDVAEVAGLALNAAQMRTEYEARQELLQSREDAVEDPSARAFFKEYRKVVEASDVIMEVLDCRDPLGCRSFNIEQSIKSEFGDKKQIVLVLNKVDLVPEAIREKWMKYFMRQDKDAFPTVCFSTKDHTILAESIRVTTQVLKQSGRTSVAGHKRITVGVIGMPNVGKSSIINALKREEVVSVGNTPGLTKQASEVRLTSHITIMDCPGIIFSGDVDRNRSVLRGGIKVETLDDVITPVECIVDTVPREALIRVYGLDQSFSDCQEFLSLVAHKKGRIMKGGEPLLEEAARIVLRNWNDGLIEYYTEPPAEEEDDETFKMPLRTQREQHGEGVPYMAPSGLVME